MNNPATFPQELVRTQDIEKPKTISYTDWNKIFITLCSEFAAQEKNKCDKRREFRRHHVNVAEERKSGTLLADETKIPDRTIETNIRRDKSPLVRLLTQPTTVLSFVDANQPGVDFAPLANYYTQLNRQTGWQIEWLYLIDALQLHGAAYMEVFFDPAHPLGSRVEYVRRDHLIYPLSSRSLDSNSCILRRYEITKEQFESFAATKHFDPVQAEKIRKHYENRSEQIILHRVLMKLEGVMNCAWVANGDGIVDDWLMPPAPYDIGLRKTQLQPVPPTLGNPNPEPIQTFVPVQLTSYPLFVFPLDLEEDEVILSTQGRVSLDLHTQEALTALLSSIANCAVRASGLYPARKKDPTGDTPRNQETFGLRHGHIVEGEFTFGKLEWPSAVAVSIAQFLRTHNASQAGGIDWASMNRTDTAKTATELTMAREESDSLKSMSTLLFAICMLQVELLRWSIWLSQVATEQKPAPSLPVPINIHSPTLIPCLSAEQQVIKRAEQQTKYIQYFPMAAGTPYQLPMLETMLMSAFPQEFPGWQQQVGVMNQMQQQVQTILGLLQNAFAVLRSMKLDAVPEEEQPAFVQFLNNLGGFLQQNESAIPGNKPSPV